MLTLFSQSLKSRGFVNEQFAWRHFYWYLNNEGIAYLREFLHLPAEASIVLSTDLTELTWSNIYVNIWSYAAESAEYAYAYC